ncbi:unnamed protein product [Durusdinium trenchii]|uniref:AP2/ERF domain-containing protein n=1 Tax=Durusdinium trenchii TaxID=1381693 RepID=A0ABP0HJW6_9DINO
MVRTMASTFGIPNARKAKKDSRKKHRRKQGSDDDSDDGLGPVMLTKKESRKRNAEFEKKCAAEAFRFEQERAKLLYGRLPRHLEERHEDYLARLPRVEFSSDSSDTSPPRKKTAKAKKKPPCTSTSKKRSVAGLRLGLEEAEEPEEPKKLKQKKSSKVEEPQEADGEGATGPGEPPAELDKATPRQVALRMQGRKDGRLCAPLIENLKSGVKGIVWDAANRSWRINNIPTTPAGLKGKRTSKTFSVAQHGGYEEALEKAKEHFYALVAKGILKASKEKTLPQSEVPGVKWNKRSQRWEVLVKVPRKKRIYAGQFKTREEAEAKARTVWQQHELQPLGYKEYVESKKPQPPWTPTEACSGVRWCSSKANWHVRTQFFRRWIDKSFPLKVLTAEEGERAWREACAWLKKEKERITEATPEEERKRIEGARSGQPGRVTQKAKKKQKDVKKEEVKQETPRKRARVKQEVKEEIKEELSDDNSGALAAVTLNEQ